MDSQHSDYLVIGAGAMGMAFTDVLMAESDASVTIVDRYHQPGGHWNVAYPFVRLHQPSSFYGVNSRRLGSDRIDTTGWNKGLYELAGKGEICAYYDSLMHDFVSSGRVQYLPMSEYHSDGNISSLICGAQHKVKADKIVDATFMNVRVPSMGKPSYEVAQGVECAPPNALVNSRGEWNSYVVVGAGKTGIDACLFLLENGVNPANICWIKPRESWLWDRANAQAEHMFETSIRPFSLNQIKSIAASESVQDVFARASAEGLLLRIDDNIKPTMFRCATVSLSEIAALRRIENVVRMGRVQSISQQRVTLEGGSFNYGPNTLFVDCTADGLARRPPEPVFSNHTITLQSVRTCQQVFSAAFIAHLELTEKDMARKNLLCTPVPHPDTDMDYLRNTLADLVNGAMWYEDESLQAWMKTSRLDGFSYSESSSAEADAEFARSLQGYGLIAAQKLAGYLAEPDAS